MDRGTIWSMLCGTVSVACLVVGAPTTSSKGRTAAVLYADRVAPIGLLRTVPVGHNPVAIGVDERTGHVFVVTTGPLGRPSPVGALGQPTGRGQVAMLDAGTGAPLSMATIGRNPRTVVAVASTTGRVFAFTGNTDDEGLPVGSGHTYVLDARTDRVVTTVSLPGQPIQAVVAERSGHVFTGNITGYPVSMLDARTGAEVPITTTAAPPLAVDDRRGRIYGRSQGANSLTVIDAQQGRQLFETLPLGNHYTIVEGVAVDEHTGSVIANTNDERSGAGAVSVIDPAPDGLMQTSQTDGGSASSIAMDDSINRAFVLECPNGGYETQQSSVGTCSVFVIDLRSGAVVTKSHVDMAKQMSAQAVVVDVRLGRAFVLTQAGAFNNGAYPAGPSGAGTLSVFDARSGHLLHQVRVRGGLAGMVIDEQTQRLFVANKLAGTVDVYNAARL